VTIDGKTLPLPKPFIVLATQNPIEYHGTYPLPEAQLDRFMLQVDLGYPPVEIERSLVINRTSRDPVETIQTIMSLEALNGLRAKVDEVKIETSVSQYLLQIITATRQHQGIRLGVSTRGTLLYGRIVRARALLKGRDYVLPEDVKALAIPALSHRILLTSKGHQSGNAATSILEEILASVPVPR
jgi:MoxR-like ATPase